MQMLEGQKKPKILATAIFVLASIFLSYLILSQATPTTESRQKVVTQSLSSSATPGAIPSSLTPTTSSSSSSTNATLNTIMEFKQKLTTLSSNQTRGEIVDWYYQQGVFLDLEHLGPTDSQYSTYDLATLNNLANNGDREAITEIGKRIGRKGNYEAAKDKLNTAAAMGSLEAFRELAWQSELELNKLTRTNKTTPTLITQEELRAKQLELLARWDLLRIHNDVLSTEGFFNGRDFRYDLYGENLSAEDVNSIQMNIIKFENEVANTRNSPALTEQHSPQIPEVLKDYSKTLLEFIAFCKTHEDACKTLQ